MKNEKATALTVAAESLASPNLSAEGFLGVTGESNSWRDQLRRLESLDLPLLAVGAGLERKAPADLGTGLGLPGWTTAKHTVREIQAACKKVIAAGTRTGEDAHGLLVFDLDGETAVSWCLDKRCDPAATPTWQIHRNTDESRLKLAFKLSDTQQQQLGQIKSKVETKPPVKDDAGEVIAKGEAVELFHQGGSQVIVIGHHHKSKGLYLWPDAMGPEDLAPIPECWWQAALTIAGNTTTKARSTSKGDWQSLNPCPICGRDTTGYCSQHKDSKTIRCFHGSTFAPPKGLRAGDEIPDKQGNIWAFSKAEAQKSGDVFSVFVEPKPERRRNSANPRQQAQQAHATERAGPPAPSPSQPKERKARPMSHSKAMACFDRCVEVQAQRERNSLRRRARLLKAAKDLGLATFVKPQDIAQKVLEAKARCNGEGFKPLTAADRAAMPKPVVRWLVRGLIPAGDMTIIGGRPKVGKTRLALAVVAAVLRGEPFLEFPVAASTPPVLLVTDDQSAGDSADMLTALGIWTHPRLVTSENFRLTEPDLDALLAAIKANPGALVVLDSLRSTTRALQHGENDPEIGATLYDLKQAVIDAGGTLLLIHHCNKAADLVGVEALSGHGAISGAANTVITLHHCPNEKGLPDKINPQRRLFSEGRSGDGCDVVIDRAASGSFRQVSTFEHWQKQLSEAKKNQKLERLTELQQQALDALNDSGEWMTRRQVCKALELPWGDRGQSKEAKNLAKTLTRLVELKAIESANAGREATYRSCETQIVGDLVDQPVTARYLADSSAWGSRRSTPATSAPLIPLIAFEGINETHCEDRLIPLIPPATDPPVPGFVACTDAGATVMDRM